MNILLEANSIVNDRKEEKEIMEILLNAGYKKSSANWYINKYKSNESN